MRRAESRKHGLAHAGNISLPLAHGEFFSHEGVGSRSGDAWEARASMHGERLATICDTATTGGLVSGISGAEKGVYGDLRIMARHLVR